MKEKIKVSKGFIQTLIFISVLVSIIIALRYPASINAQAPPTCLLSMEPSEIQQGDTAWDSWKIVGDYNKVTVNCDGVLSYKGGGWVEEEVKHGGKNTGMIQPKSIGTGSCKWVVCGPGGCSECANFISVLPKPTTEELAKLSTFELIGNENLRSCPLTSCSIIQAGTFDGLAKLLEKSEDWYQVEIIERGKLYDYGVQRVPRSLWITKEGWLHESLIPENVKQTFITSQQKEQVPPSEENQAPKEEVQNKLTLLLSFTQNKNFQTSLIIAFVFIVFLLIIFLLRKKITAISLPKWRGINLQKIKFKQKSFTISIFIATGIAMMIIGISYGATYYQVSKLIEEADQFTKEEKYNEALEKLEIIQNKWLTKNLGIKKQEITNKIGENRKLVEDKLEYNLGIEEFNKENWGNAKELLSKVSEISPYYQEAKNKIDEVQKKIIERQITEAVEKATEETKRAVEKVQRKAEEERGRQIIAETQRRVEEEKTKEKTAELEQKIAELQQKQQLQAREGHKVSEIVKHLGKYIVYIACFDRNGNAMIGSGIIYNLGSKGQTIVLTNYHITEYADLTQEYPCVVAYSSDPTRGLTDFYFAEPIHFPSAVSLSTMRSIDFDFLSIEAKFRLPEYERIEIIPNAPLKITDYGPVICSENKIKVGEEIVVLGYPGIGGEYLTATEGIISGYQGKYYLTTSAKVEEGNSGGGAFLKSTGCLVGMPAFVVLGRIEGLARLINMSVLQRDYLSRIWRTTTTGFSDSIFCNNEYWHPCPTGQKFHCPPVGDPSCR